jgi:hypothetical protein
MRQLEDIGAEAAPAGHQRLLAGRLHVSGEQQPDACYLNQEDQAAVVLLRRLGFGTERGLQRTDDVDLRLTH